jgi:hypothetical protein
MVQLANFGPGGQNLPTLEVLRYNRAEGEGCDRGSNGVGTEDFIFSANFFSQFNKPQKARFVI